MTAFAPSRFPTPPPATLAASGVWNSGAVPSGDAAAFSAAATLSQAGTLTLQRYIDNAGQIPYGAAMTATLVATVPNFVGVADGAPVGSFQVSVTNTSGSTGNLMNVFARTLPP